MRSNKIGLMLLSIAVLLTLIGTAFAVDQISREESRAKGVQKLQEKFSWWGTSGAQPAPVRDTDRGGYWWMPKKPTTADDKEVWGNGGYIYVYKIIFDYKEEELPAPKPKEMRPSLLVKKIIKNVKIYFDYDKSDIRDDASKILANAAELLKRNKESSLLISGNCDVRGSEKYNDKLGKNRGLAVKKFMQDQGVADERIKIISRGKLDAIAPVTDLEGMQKDRNAQFMVAEVEEVMIPYPDTVQAQESGAKAVEEGKYVVEKEETVESETKVSTKEYVTKKGDTLWKIAEEVYGNGRKWKNIYRFNQDKIKDPNRLKAGLTLTIPIE